MNAALVDNRQTQTYALAWQINDPARMVSEELIDID
jgi:hypothetical protein